MNAASQQETSSRRAAPGRALVPFVPVTAAATAPWPSMRASVLAVTCCLVLGASAAGAFVYRHALPFGSAKPAVSVAMVHGLQDQVVRLQQSLDGLRMVAETSRADEQLRALKHTVEALKQDVEQVRTGASGTVAQLSARIDKADHDPSQKLNEIATRLDRMERDGGKAAEIQRLADLSNRIDRVEKQVSDPAATGSVPITRTQAAPGAPAKTATTAALPKSAALSSPAAVKGASVPPIPQVRTAALFPAAAKSEVTQVVATPAAKPLPERSPLVTGWVLRDVYDGMALVQARGGGLREIEPGQYLPGAGEVRAIERHGRSWVVLTSRGVIADAVD